ncbi:MAG: methylated-DNA--[protein]-cysteine S-methyltransferase [Anaerolineales bacterium]
MTESSFPADMVAWTAMPSPLGTLYLARTHEGLAQVRLAEGEGSPMDDDRLLAEARHQLEQYFAGNRRHFDLPLDLTAISATPFQRRVWSATREIPYGTAQSYGELAESIGSPRAARAVGQALGRNPLLIVVPCHRVVRSDGGLGGFGAGLDNKRALLTLEGHLQD